MPKSRHKLKDCVAWAEDRKAKGGHINDAYSVGRARWMDGTDDDMIAVWLDRREQVLAGRPPVERRVMPFPAAAQMVNSVKQSGGDCRAYIVNELGDRVSDHDREQLLDTFVRKSAPELQRAHAPSGQEGAA